VFTDQKALVSKDSQVGVVKVVNPHRLDIPILGFSFQCSLPTEVELKKVSI